MENQDDNEALLKVAEAVSDGTPVDWESAQSLRDEAELAHLQALEVVAAAHRSARLNPGNIGSTAARGCESSHAGGHPPERAEPPLTFSDTAPSGRRSIKMLRGWVILGLALVALYIILQLLWRS